MILTVTPNPAVDVTYEVDRLNPGSVHRVTEVIQRAGGKGINVAMVLRALGEQVTATGFSGGRTGQWLEQQVVAAGVGAAFVPALPEVRRTLVIHGSGQTTSLWEPGQPPTDPAQAERVLEETVATLLSGQGDTVRVVTVSGSLPAGISPDLPARLATLAGQHAVPVVLDLDGEPLRSAVAAGVPAVLTPNQDEIEALTGTRPTDAHHAAILVRPLLDAGVSAVVATLGEAGMVAVWSGGAVAAAPPERVAGNPTGAGDAATAAIARYLARPTSAPDWPALVTDAVATSAASVLRRVAGEVDLAARERFCSAITPYDPEA